MGILFGLVTEPTVLAPEFVSFHADRPAGVASVHPNAKESRGYMRRLDLLFRSARHFHPDAECTLLTDLATRVRGIHGRLRRIDTAIEHSTLMWSRSLAQLQCIEQSRFERPLILVDSDILFRGSLQPLFAEDFDVGLTWRGSERMPINGGLLVLNNRRPDVVKDFFRRFVALYRARHGGESAAWYGDQLALRDLIGLDHQAMKKQPLCEVDGVRVRFLPCDPYNYSPDNTWSAIASGLADKVVLHFKGQRKRLMELFWEVFLQPQASRLPWAYWRGERALRRLEGLARHEAPGIADGGVGAVATSEDADG